MKITALFPLWIRRLCYTFLTTVNSLLKMANITEIQMKVSSLDPQMQQENLLSPQEPIHKYKPGDIIYVLFDINRGTSPEYPHLGSPYEIDCKIISQLSDGEQTHGTKFRVISGTGYIFNVAHYKMIPAIHRTKAAGLPMYISTINTELFPENTVFYVTENYACNDVIGVYISLERFKLLTFFKPTS